MKRQVRKHPRLADETPLRAPRVRDGCESAGVDDGEPNQFLALSSDTIEHGLTNIQHLRACEKALPERRKLERQSIVRRVGILFHPPELDERGHDPMRAALLQTELVRDIAQ